MFYLLVKDYERVLFQLAEEQQYESTNNQMLQESFLRIKRMEQLFDWVTDIIHNKPDETHSSSFKKAIQMLSDYCTNGEWMHDYELDEQGLLPPDLKRGVLSQDGLYDLLSETAEIKIG